jgi:hypothetical protein
MKLGLIIPTRHRAELAIASIRSALADDHPALTVIVSDNSSRDEEVLLLAEFCRTANHPRLIYIRPPEALTMPAHWDWAIEQAMARTDATHFGFQYDRKVFKAGSIPRLAAVCAQVPAAVVTYTCDFTIKEGGGFVAWRYPASDKLYEIPTAAIVRAVASGTVHDLGQAIPLFSNCMVPRPVLDRVRARFGNICDSNAPDLTFLFRFCAVEARYLHFDSALSIMYAFRFSNGQGYFRRATSGTFRDFMELWQDRPWLNAAPIPGLTLGLNVAFHEYNLVQEVAGIETFPAIEMQGYLRELARGFFYIHDEQERAELEAVLQRHGWRPEAPAKARPLWRRIASRVARPLRRVKRRRRGAFDLSTHRFTTEDESLNYLLSNPVAPVPHNALLTILDAAEVASPQ